MNKVIKISDAENIEFDIAKKQLSINCSNIYFKAIKSKKVKDYKDANDVAKLVISLINQTILNDLGYKIDKHIIDAILLTVPRDILRDFNTLTIDEVEIAFTNGVRGNYGEYIGINPVTFYKWLKYYKEQDEERKKLQKILIKIRDNKQKSISQKTEITEKEKKDIEKRWLGMHIRRFNDLKKTGFSTRETYLDINNNFYDYLIDKGILKITKENYQKYYDYVKDRKLHITQKKNVFEQALYNDNEDGAIIRKTKSLILNQFIYNSIKNNKDLGKLIRKAK